MKFSTFLASWRTGRLPLLLRLDRLLHPLYRVTFLASASACGLLRRLSGGPVSFEGIAAELAPAPRDREALEAWLHLGVQLKELGLGPQGYILRGKLARQLADPAHDGAAAFLEEAASLHHALLSRTP